MIFTLILVSQGLVQSLAAFVQVITLEGAAQLSETLRQRVEVHSFVFQGETIPVRISMGAAQLSDSMTSNDLITEADAKLYEAKRGGRNRVCH